MGFLLPTTKVSVSKGKTNEFGITSSSYDKEIPIGYGIDRIPGNIIWANNIQQEKVVTTTKQGGKGSPKVKTTTTTYLYYVDLALLLCAGPISDIYRIWADGKVIYDAITGQQINGLDFRIYRGTEDQMPDPLIELAVGEGLTPAYRGSAYIVFERLPLVDFGNRIPGFTFEVAFSGESSSNVEVESISSTFTNEIFSGDGGGTYTSFVKADRAGGTYWNFATNELYTSADSHSGLGSQANVRIDPVNRTLAGMPSRTSPINFGNNRINGIFELTGDYGVGQAQNVGSERRDIFLRDRDTAVTLLTVDADFSSRQVNGQIMNVGGVPVSIGTDTSAGDLSHLGWKAVNMVDPGVVGSFGFETGWQYLPVQLGRTSEYLTGSGVFAEAFGLRVKSDRLQVVQIVAPSPDEVVMAVIETVFVTDVVPGATSWNTNPAWAVSRTNGEIYVQSTIDGTPYIWCWSPNSSSVEWRTQVPHVLLGRLDLVDPDNDIISHIPLRNGTQGRTLLVGNNWVWVDNQKRVIRVNLTNGMLDNNFNGVNVFPDIAEGDVGGSDGGRSIFHWNDATSTLVNVEEAFRDVPAGVYFHQFSFTPGGDISPRQVISDLCVRAGLTTSDIDVTAVPEAQEGLRSVVAFERGTVAETVEPLLDLLELEVVESDFKLKFFPRGSVGSVATITEDQMVPTDENEREPYAQAFSKEEDLPQRFEVSYREFTTDYQESVGADERSEVSQFSQSVEGFSFNGACTADLPRRSAQVKLYSAWAEREKIRTRLPHRFLRLDAGDVVTLQLDTGAAVTGRLRQTAIGADLSVNIEQVAETTGVYESNIDGSTSGGHFTSTIPNTGDSLLGLLDIPLLRDVDSIGPTQTVTYWVANGAPAWPGVVNFRETGSSTVQEVGQQVTGVPYGVLSTVPPDMDRTVNRFTDDSFRIIVADGIDEFESVSEADVLAGRNLLAIVKTNGEIELLSFKDVTVVSATVLELSGLLRGRRGTDAFANGFTAGERVYLLDAAWTDRFSQALSTVGAAQTYRGVTIGQLYEDADPVSFTGTARDLRPYSPAHVRVEDDGLGGLDISWSRRTRIGGENDWLLAGDVPLSETAEAYEVDVLDAPGGSVLRTLTSSSETVNYAAADVTTDFGSLPATINLVVYQISSEVGRGFPATESLSTG